MFKLFALLVAVVAAPFYWWWRREEARQRLKEIDEGKRCVACDSIEVSVEEGKAFCRTCGYAPTLASLQAAQLSSAELWCATQTDTKGFRL